MKSRQKETLEESFQQLLSLYGIHGNISNLKSEIIREPGPLKPRELVEIGKRLDADVKITKAGFAALQQVDAPCLALLKNGQGFLVIPGKTDEEVKTLENAFANHIVRINVAPATDAVQTGHMWKAHAIDWFWQPITAFWKNYTEIIVCSIFINIFVMAMPVFTMNVYDKVVPNFAESTLYVLVIGIVIALIFDFLLKTMRSYILEHVAASVGSKYDCDLMEQFFRIPPLSNAMSVGEKANIFRELQGIRDFYASKLAPAVVDLPFFLLFIAVIAIISPVLSLITIAGAIIIIAVNMAVQFKVKRLTKKYFEDMQAKSATLIEMLSGINTIRMVDAVGNQLFRWKMATERSAKSSNETQFMMGLAVNFSLMVMFIINVATILLGVYEIHAGKLTMGGLVAATILSSRAISPVMGIAAVVSRMRQSSDVLKAIDGIFKIPTDIDGNKTSSLKGPFKGEITLRDVTFFYPGQIIPALDSVNLNIRPGEHVGLIGQTGAGKSTLAKIISGYMAPGSGSILLDGFALDAIHPSELRNSIGEVPQKPHFFRGSVRDNIILGSENISEKDLEGSELVRSLMQFIQQTGYGYDTSVGEDGNKLSGGQQQAVAMARALARNPSILVFDEPTTGMDHALEMRVRDGLKKYLEGRTFIMVTHRTTLLPLVDRLILLDRGKIVADGPRDEVLKRISGNAA